jgi:hypothetical protein
MNKFTYALALGAGLVLCVAGPSAHAAPIVQTLSPQQMSAATFNSLFTPVTAPMISQYQFQNTPLSGVVESQVFSGSGAATGLYAYAYQFGVNNVTDSTGQPTFVNSASMIFNATPVGTNFSGMPNTYAYVITNGQAGGLDLPQAAPGNLVQTPSSIAWYPGSKTGSVTFQYLDPTKNEGPLGAGAKSGTIVLISTQPFTQQYVSLQNPNPQTGYPLAYSPQLGTIAQVPAPEPTTILAWTGMIGAVAVAHRLRRHRKAN